jgi:pre-mRNA-processing factor 39
MTSIVNQEWLKVSTELVLDPNNLGLWEKLISTAEYNQKRGINKSSSSEELELLRESYKGLLRKYPLLFNYWIKYATWEFKLGNTDIANAIYCQSFQYLDNSIEMWVDYLQFKVNTISNNLDEVLSLFETARNKIGLHFHSYEFYKLYLSFLKNYQTLENKYQLKYFVLLRMVIEIPLYHYEYFFKILLDQIAQLGTSKQIKDSVLPFLVPKRELHNFSKLDLKSTAVQLKKIFVDLYITTQYKVYELYNFEKKLSKPYFDLNFVSQQQLGLWDRYLNFLELKSYDHDCIRLTYERCLIPTASYAQFWTKYCDYFIQNSDHRAAITLLNRAIFFCNDPKLIVKLVDLHVFLGEILRAKDIIVQYIRSNVFIPLPIYEKLLNIEGIIHGKDEEYMIQLFKELIKETNNDWFFEHVLYYSIPYQLKKSLFTEYGSKFQNSTIYNKSLKKLEKYNFQESPQTSTLKYDEEILSFL